MKRFSAALVVLAGLCLLTVYGAHNASATEAAPSATVDPDGPMTFPLSIGEAPVTALSAPQYPDPIRVSIVLKDLTDEVDYDLEDYALDGFTVWSGHDYQLSLQMRSDGDDIKDIEFVAEEPKASPDDSRTTFWLYARNRTTKQDLMVARVFIRTIYGVPGLELSDAAADLFDNAIYIGDIGGTPVEFLFDFHVR